MKMIKFSEENVREKFNEMKFCNDFLDIKAKAQNRRTEYKINNLYFIKTKTPVHQLAL